MLGVDPAQGADVDAWWWQQPAEAGLLRRRNLVAGGVPPDTVGAAVRRQHITPVQRGIYLPGKRQPGALDEAQAALFAVDEPGSAVSHHTAARLHGLVVPDGGPAHLTIPRPERRPHRDRLVLHTARLPAPDVVVLDGVATTAVARTLVDLCRVLGRVSAVWALEDAMRRGLVTAAELAAAARRLARTPGIIRARERLRAADPRSQSPLETDARMRLADAGLPPPEPQMQVVLPDGRSAFIDLGYPEHRVGIELDGRAWHELPEAVFRDRHRQNGVAVTELMLLRFTWWDVVHDTARFVDQVRTALARRR